MNEHSEADASMRHRITTRGEDALGKLAQDLLENPLVNSALTRAFYAREKAAQAQEVAMGALNLPSAADLERLTRRLRSVSQRLEGIEDGVDRIDRTLGSPAGGDDTDRRLSAIEEQLTSLTSQLHELAERLPGANAPVARGQERLEVDPGASDPELSSGRRSTRRAVRS